MEVNIDRDTAKGRQIIDSFKKMTADQIIKAKIENDKKLAGITGIPQNKINENIRQAEKQLENLKNTTGVKKSDDYMLPPPVIEDPIKQKAKEILEGIEKDIEEAMTINPEPDQEEPIYTPPGAGGGSSGGFQFLPTANKKVEDEITNLTDRVSKIYPRVEDAIKDLQQIAITAGENRYLGIEDGVVTGSLAGIAISQDILKKIRDTNPALISLSEELNLKRLYDIRVKEVQGILSSYLALASQNRISLTQEFINNLRSDVRSQFQEYLDKINNPVLQASSVDEDIKEAQKQILVNAIDRYATVAKNFVTPIKETPQKADPKKEEADNILKKALDSAWSGFLNFWGGAASTAESIGNQVLPTLFGIQAIFTDLFNGVGIDFANLFNETNKVTEEYRTKQIQEQLARLKGKK